MTVTNDLYEHRSSQQTVIKALLRGMLRLFFHGLVRPPVPVWLQRWIIRLLTMLNHTPRSVVRGQQNIHGVPCEWQHGAASGRRVMLYLHGGAFMIGAPATHRAITANLAALGGMSVCVPDYRLAPEHPYPAAADDCLAVYRGLLELGYQPGQISIAGDSAGGNLALVTALRIRDLGLPLPAALVCFSPVTDFSSEAIHNPPAGDPLINLDWMAQARSAYCPAPLDLHMPGVSPLNADLAGLPPVLLQVGEDEVLRDDSLRFAERARAAGVEVQLQRYEGLWHVFQAHAGVLRVADLALERVVGFLREWVK
ncbi:alpha/beta hydrolase [Pseudomonas sp. N040]|uniref:alpha/beta hydrolase n=1 Tax=Pseudomonas sp. N040 TaxID=2785325 RepID=UPI0018A31C2C|nr:alpha/beta hydrolase [Pseudomonas sp. N040]MBF7731415.1 alpha/beta hydrolase [Pseudomonas sp. N040]MBW7015059.1 alpha/beta hydrolase [Pseudomonas sp. N040]